MLLEFLKFYETYVRYIVPILAKFTCREVNLLLLLGLLGGELRDRATSDEEVGDHGDD